MNHFLKTITSAWYNKSVWLLLLWPLSLCYRLIVAVRRLAYQTGFITSFKFPVPVIVVGNITVGGSGKTPLVIYLVKALQDVGWNPGVVSRGYGGTDSQRVQSVNGNGDPKKVGDESVLIAKRTQCPVVVCHQRSKAVEYLMQNHDCDIVISDDGLQHYKLQRDIEIVVIDGERGLGNRFCLPAGPLREPEKRLASVDWIVVNGETHGHSELFDGFSAASSVAMQLSPTHIHQLSNPKQTKTFADFNQSPVHAVAAIGHPQRFFNVLRKAGLDIIEHPFADHYSFTAADMNFNDEYSILMTEKDAVKCLAFANDKHFCVAVEASVGDGFFKELTEQLSLSRHYSAT